MVRAKAVAEAIAKEGIDYLARIDEYKTARINAYKLKLSTGFELIRKLNKRFRDLPEEAFAVNNLASLFNTGETMIESAFDGWADVLSLEHIKPTHTAEIEAIQKLVESGILPQSALEQVNFSDGWAKPTHR